MGIKEEIEGLKVKHAEDFEDPEDAIYITGTNSGIRKALAVLDEYEVIAEGRLTNSGGLNYLVGGRYLEWFLNTQAKLGHHTIILQKKEDEKDET